MRFAPSVYEHAARVIGRSPWQVSRKADLLCEAHSEAFRLYGHSPVVVGIDIYNLEPEAYGAVVERPDGTGTPAVTTHPLAAVRDIAKLAPVDTHMAGRIRMVIDAARRIAARFHGADVRVPVSGPFSIAANLVGFETLLSELATEPATVAGALRHLVAGQVGFSREIVRNGLGVALFESAAAPPLVSPAQFREVELPALKLLMQGAAEAVGRPVPCVMGGDTFPILDAILETGTGYVVCPAATDRRAFMEKMKSRPDVTVRVNMDSRPLAAGDLDAALAAADTAVTLALTRAHVRGSDNACIGTGCLPYEADPKIVLEVKAHVESVG